MVLSKLIGRVYFALSHIHLRGRKQLEKIRRRGGRKQTEKTAAENKRAENKIICKIMNDIRENKRILEKIREYGSTCFKSNEYPYEYIIEDEKVVFYHKITGREIGSADLELTVGCLAKWLCVSDLSVGKPFCQTPVIASALLNELLTFKYKSNVKNSKIRLGRSKRNC